MLSERTASSVFYAGVLLTIVPAANVLFNVLLGGDSAGALGLFLTYSSLGVVIVMFGVPLNMIARLLSGPGPLRRVARGPPSGTARGTSRWKGWIRTGVLHYLLMGFHFVLGGALLAFLFSHFDLNGAVVALMIFGVLIATGLNLLLVYAESRRVVRAPTSPRPF